MSVNIDRGRTYQAQRDTDDKRATTHITNRPETPCSSAHYTQISQNVTGDDEYPEYESTRETTIHVLDSELVEDPHSASGDARKGAGRSVGATGMTKDG